MTSTDLAVAVLRACSYQHNMSPEDLYGMFPTVDRTNLGELVYELAATGLLLADVNRSGLIDGPVVVLNSITRTSLVGEAWLAQIGADDTPPTLH